MALQELTKLLKERISRPMTMGIVEMFETIQIDHNDAKWMQLSCSTAQFPFQRLIHLAPVEQAGQRITNGLLMQSLTQLGIIEYQSRQVGKEAPELNLIRCEIIFRLLSS